MFLSHGKVIGYGDLVGLPMSRSSFYICMYECEQWVQLIVGVVDEVVVSCVSYREWVKLW